MSEPGWFNDVSDPTLVRWHDGATWTHHVADKAEWEAVGHAPPPPGDDWDDWDDGIVPVAGSSRRARALVASAVGVAVLAVGGFALAQGGGSGGATQDPPARPAQQVDSAEDGSTTTVTSLVDPGVDLGTATAGDEGTDGGSGSGTGTGGASSTGRTAATTGSSTKRTTATTTAGGVRKTETRQESHTNTGPIGGGQTADQTNVGHSNDSNLANTYQPPVTTETTSPPDTTATTAPPDVTVTTSAGTDGPT